MENKAGTRKPTHGLDDSEIIAQMVRGQIYAELDGMLDSTNRVKKMSELVKLAEEAKDYDAANAARGALNALVTAATA